MEKKDREKKAKEQTQGKGWLLALILVIPYLDSEEKKNEISKNMRMLFIIQAPIVVTTLLHIKEVFVPIPMQTSNIPYIFSTECLLSASAMDPWSWGGYSHDGLYQFPCLKSG